MTTVRYLSAVVIPGAMRLLPLPMDTPAARAMLMAIAHQESGCKYRRQVGGPAKGFYQFETAGVKGVLLHPKTKAHVADAMAALAYPVVSDPMAPYLALEHNDILATVFARLLLWTDPSPLPAQDAPEDGWAIYLHCWRPGRPREEAWSANFKRAWEVTNEPGASHATATIPIRADV